MVTAFLNQVPGTFRAGSVEEFCQKFMESYFGNHRPGDFELNASEHKILLSMVLYGNRCSPERKVHVVEIFIVRRTCMKAIVV